MGREYHFRAGLVNIINTQPFTLYKFTVSPDPGEKKISERVTEE